ncbi:MAG: hypothetical protein ACO4AC_05445 [Pseudohongiellaceae bacterium]
MKISTNEYFQKMAGYITEQQSNIAQSQLKLSKGDSLSSASENTRVATASLSLKSAVERQEAYVSNLKLLDMKLNETEVLAISARDQLTRIREILIRSANQTYSDQDRVVMGREVSIIKDNLFSMMNSTDSSGNYIFSGIKNRTKPFQKNEEGIIEFLGDNSPVNIQVGPGQSMRSNSNSQDIFPNFRRDGSGAVVEVFAAIESMEAAVASSNMAAIQTGLADIDVIANGVDTFIVSVGSRRKIIESRIDVAEERKLAMTTLYSNYRDLDYGKTVSILSSQVLALEAAQSSIAKVSQLTLFNYIR